MKRINTKTKTKGLCQILSEEKVNHDQFVVWIKKGLIERPSRYWTEAEAGEFRAAIRKIKSSTFKLSELAKELGLKKSLVYKRLKLLGHTKQNKHIYDIGLKKEFAKAVKEYVEAYESAPSRDKQKRTEAGLYTRVSAAEYFGIPLNTLVYWTKRNQISKPSHKVGLFSYYTQADLEQIKQIKAEYFKKKGKRQ